MGNEQGCCVENQNYYDIQKYENSINPIKYGGKIYKNQKTIDNKKTNMNKNIFTGKIIEKQIISQFRYSNSDQYKKGNSLINKQQKMSRQQELVQKSFQRSKNSKIESNGQRNKEIQFTFDKYQMNPENIIKQQTQQSKYRQSPPYSNQSEIYQKKQSIRLSKTSQQQQSKLRTSSKYSNNFSKIQQQNIIIEYAPVVSKIITRQKPFEQQLSEIPKQNIKKIKLNNGKDVYKGQINQNRQPHGYGILIKQNKNVYVGHFINGKPQGYAYFILNNGSYYKGNISRNMANDIKGELHTKKLTYIGEFKNNQFSGECQQLGDDYYFKGLYQNNKRKKGSLAWAIKIMKHQSHVDKNKLSSTQNHSSVNKSSPNIAINNNSIMRQQDNNNVNVQLNDDDLPPIRNFSIIPKYQYIFEGFFDADQKFTSIGKLTQPNGIYQGNFSNGIKQGKGQYNYFSKLKYIGNYKNDKKQGFGILKNCDDTIAYEGEWKDGLPNGKGASYDLQGKKTQAQFVNGLNSKIIPISQISSYSLKKTTFK